MRTSTGNGLVVVLFAVCASNAGRSLREYISYLITDFLRVFDQNVAALLLLKQKGTSKNMFVV